MPIAFVSEGLEGLRCLKGSFLYHGSHVAVAGPLGKQIVLSRGLVSSKPPWLLSDFLTGMI